MEMKKLLTILMCGLLLLSGCEEDVEPLVYPPTLITGQVAEMTRVKAVLSGTAIPHSASILKCDIGFLVSTTDQMTDPQIYVATEESVGGNQYKVTVAGLNPGTKYYYCLYARSGEMLVKDNPQTFTTNESTAPVLSVPATPTFDETSITLNSQVIDDGDDTPTIRGFAYKVLVEGDTEPTKSDNVVLGSLSLSRGQEETFTATAVNLQPNTTYIIRAYATNNVGTGYSQSLTLKTNELMIPKLTVSSPANLTSYTATVTGAVTDNRGLDVSECGFCWSAENRLPVIGTKNQVTTAAQTTFTNVVEGLNSKTKYYLRAYATNAKGTGYSAPIEFTTVEEQTASLTKMIVTDITAETAMLTAEIATSVGAVVSEKGFCYGTEHNPTKESHPQASSGQGNQLKAGLTGLTEGMTYYARAYAVTRDNTYYSNEVEFHTIQLLAPTIGNPIFKNITETAATVTANIVANGGSAVVERGICYSTTNSKPEIGGVGVTSKESEATDIAHISVNLTGLSGGARYYVAAYARNAKAIAYSTAATLVMQENTVPEVNSLTVMEIKDDNAQAKAFISNIGGKGLKVTERGFVWAIQSANANPTLENCIGKVVADGTTENFEALLSNLAYNTTYCVRGYAKNDKVTGAGYSKPISFTTGYSSSPTLSNGRITLLKSDKIAISATISHDGGATITEVGICWIADGSDAEPTIQDNHVKGVLNGNTFTASATGLTHSTAYRVRAYAKNKDKNGVSYINFGRQVTSERPPLPGDNQPPGETIGRIPTMNSVGYTGRFPTKLVISSSIGDKGNLAITAQGFVWSTTDCDPEVGKTGCTTIPIPLGQELRTVITGLTPATTYFIRSFATNELGTGYSYSNGFTTEEDKNEPGKDDNLLPGTDNKTIRNK